MEARISEALVSLDSMISMDSFSTLNEEERLEYEKRVTGLSKNWWILSNKSYLPSPREIARYGWDLTDTNTLECKICHVKLRILEHGLDTEGNSSSFLIKDFTEFNDVEFDQKIKQIGTLRYSHKSYCSFALVEIPLRYEMIYATSERLSRFRRQIPLASPPAVYCYLYYLSVLKTNQQYTLPCLSQTTLDSIRKHQESFNVASPDIDIHNSAIIFALTGWKLQELSSGSNNISNITLSKRERIETRYTFTCEWCHRIVGNWNFKSSSEEIDNPSKKQKVGEEGYPSTSLPEFDGLGQHLEFCPWVHSLEDESPGWEQVMEFYHSNNRQDTSLVLQAESGYTTLVSALN